MCKENKLKEFYFKLVHRILVSKKELHLFGVSNNSKCTVYLLWPARFNKSYFHQSATIPKSSFKMSYNNSTKKTSPLLHKVMKNFSLVNL